MRDELLPHGALLWDLLDCGQVVVVRRTAYGEERSTGVGSDGRDGGDIVTAGI